MYVLKIGICYIRIASLKDLKCLSPVTKFAPVIFAEVINKESTIPKLEFFSLIFVYKIPAIGISLSNSDQFNDQEKEKEEESSSVKSSQIYSKVNNYFEKYEGYISSNDGPKADEQKIKSLATILR